MPVTICPNCQTPMNEVSRRGVFVDVCPNPKCRGVWLDGGELEKLLTAADAAQSEAPRERRYASRDDYYREHDDRRRDGRRTDRREGGIFEMFGDLFE